MSTNIQKLEVLHLQEKSRLEIQIEGQIAELDYHLRDSVMSFTHTGVPRALEGCGIGSLIVRTGLDYAREQGYKVVPICSFVDAYIQRHEKYANFFAG